MTEAETTYGYVTTTDRTREPYARMIALVPIDKRDAFERHLEEYRRAFWNAGGRYQRMLAQDPDEEARQKARTPTEAVTYGLGTAAPKKGDPTPDG